MEESGLQAQTEGDTDMAEVRNNAKYVYPGGLESCSVLPNDLRCVNLLCNPYASRLT